jgi:hypothetical protein
VKRNLYGTAAVNQVVGDDAEVDSISIFLSLVFISSVLGKKYHDHLSCFYEGVKMEVVESVVGRGVVCTRYTVTKKTDFQKCKICL